MVSLQVFFNYREQSTLLLRPFIWPEKINLVSQYLLEAIKKLKMLGIDDLAHSSNMDEDNDDGMEVEEDRKLDEVKSQSKL